MIIGGWVSKTSGLRAGGNWNNGAQAGATYRNANNVASNANRNNGSRLELRTLLFSPEQALQPVPKGRTHSIGQEVLVAQANALPCPQGT